jgi:alkylation response protein AidB-like acyl-CoA dehydrogenase
VITGQKVWTSAGQIADKAMLVARTNIDVAKHAGISYFIIDIHQPGVDMRPLREMTGRAYFNEVFMDEARVPDRNLIGGEGNGWAVANTTLTVERSLSGGGDGGVSVTPGTIAGNLDRRAGDFVVRSGGDDSSTGSFLPSQRLADLARQLGRNDDPLVRQGLMQLHTLEQTNSWTTQRARALAASGRELAGSPNLAKMSQSHAYRLTRHLTFEILGTAGTAHGYEPESVDLVEALTGIDGLAGHVDAALFASAPPIFGGSDQIQRNIVGERILGLAREPDPLKGVPYRELPKNG